MKKTTFESTYPTRYPSRVARRIWSSGVRSIATRTLEFEGKRRVRFKDTDSEEIPEASMRNRFSINGDPKTSEYAFFKRLKQGATAPRVFGPGSMTAQSNLCNPPECEIEKRKNVEGDDHVGSLLVTENMTSEKFGSFASPLAVASKKSDMKKAKTMTDDIQNQWEQTLSQNSLELVEAQHKHVDIFFKKRQKLCQWIEKNSFPEISDLRSKGGDFVSLLLARLFPETRKNKCFEGLSKVQQEADTKTELLTDSKSDIHLRNFELIPVGNAVELEYAPASDVGPLSDLSSGCPTLSYTQQMNIDKFSSNGLWTQSLLSCVPLEQPWLWSSKPTFNKSNIFHENLLQVESGMFAAPDYLLHLPCESSGVSFDAYSSYHTRRKNDSFMCFPQNSVGLLSKGLDEKHPHSGPEALVSFGDHCNLEEKCLLSVGVSPVTNGDYHSLGYHTLEFPNKVNMSSYRMNMNENTTWCGNFI